MRKVAMMLAVVGAAGLAGPASAAEPKRKTPYFASIAASKARMRTGPGRTYPISWLYVRADLPVKVLDIFKEWRRIEDPDGTQGWVLGALLSDRRTGLVQGAVAELRARPAFGAKTVWRAAPGVIGRLSECAEGWCKLDVHGQTGFVEASHLWGVDGGETLP